MNELKRIKAQQKINRESNSIILPEAFTYKFPNLKIEKAQKLFDRYLAAVCGALVNQIAWMKDGTAQVSLDAILNKCADFKYQKERFWVWNEFKDICPIITVIEKGSNLTGRKTIVEINDKMLRKLLEYTSTEQLIDQMFCDVDMANAQAEWIAIDMENLQNYIGNIDIDLAHNAADKSEQWVSKLRRNQYQAQLVYRVSEHFDGQFPQYPNPSVFGRTYYHGLSVQSMSKEVRAAAIGEHFQYDMNAAVFAIKLAVINDILRAKKIAHPEQALGATFSYTREYLREKKTVRERLANECLTSMKLGFDRKVSIIKQAITAIGFGAKTDNVAWGGKLPALSEIIMNKDDRERFLSDRFIKEFVDEQQEISVAITGYLKEQGSYDTIKDEIKATNNITRVSEAHVLAYVFQQYETEMMDHAVASAQTQTPVIARIHDAFVTKEKLSKATIMEINVKLHAVHSLLSFDVEEVDGWRSPEKRKRDDAENRRIEAHKAFIQSEENVDHAKFMASMRGPGTAEQCP